MQGGGFGSQGVRVYVLAEAAARVHVLCFLHRLHLRIDLRGGRESERESASVREGVGGCASGHFQAQRALKP